MAKQQRVPRKQVVLLVFALLGMFGFTYALVPLYNTFCKITGLNGKVEGRSRLPLDVAVDQTRTISVQFVTILNEGMPWVFYAHTPKVQVHPGEKRQVMFYAKNLSDHEIIGQAIPSVSPGLAARHFNKTECFCFSQQRLRPGESIEMPLVFFLDADLSPDIRQVTLAYTLFDATSAPTEFYQDNRGVFS